MKLIYKIPFIRLAALVVSVGMVTSGHAHLMVAQRGTLNFLDDDVYMVLSLPASAFTEADENNDSELSLTEFSQNRTAIISAVKAHVTLSTKAGTLPLHGVLVSPVTPHDAPQEPAKQVIVMGRFSLEDSDSDLSFHVGMFGTQPEEQTLEVTANRKSANQQQVFNLTPKSDVVKLRFK